MKHWTIAALLLLSACAPVVTVHKMGNEYVQDAHSRNWWGPNWHRVTYCGKLDNGYCPKEDTRVETASAIAMESPGEKMATAFAGGAPIGIGLGLMRFSQTFNSYGGTGIDKAYISTLNTPAGQFPWAK